MQYYKLSNGKRENGGNVVGHKRYFYRMAIFVKGSLPDPKVDFFWKVTLTRIVFSF